MDKKELLEAALNALDRLLNMFKVERYVYLALTGLSVALLLYAGYLTGSGPETSVRHAGAVGEHQPRRLVADRQLECCPLGKETERKGAAKLRYVPTAGCHKQSSLNSTGRGPFATGRATTVSMVRQRSVRRKPLYLQQPTLDDGMAWRDLWCDSVGLDVAD